jgi:ABC-2 type transport system permease protein
MFDLLSVEARRMQILYRRYPLEAFGGILMTAVTFYALFVGARFMAGSAFRFGEQSDGLILGYGIWTLVLFNLNRIALVLQVEAQTGTLEQLCMSPFGSLRVVLMRGLAGFLFILFMSIGLILLMLQLTGRALHFQAAGLLPLLSVFLGSYGLGLSLGALALLFKQVQQMMRLFQFVLLILVMAPFERWTGIKRILSYLLPIYPAARQLRDLMARGLPFDPGLFSIVLLNGIGHLLLGLLLFKLADREARRRGLLGQY